MFQSSDWLIPWLLFLMSLYPAPSAIRKTTINLSLYTWQDRVEGPWHKLEMENLINHVLSEYRVTGISD